LIYEPVPGVPIYYEIPIPGTKPDFTKPWCYHIDETQDPTLTCGWVPSVVVKGEWGHWPLTGTPGGEAPLVWGATLEEAKVRCVEENKKLGVMPERAIEIVLSSMRAPETEEPKGEDKMGNDKRSFTYQGKEWQAEVSSKGIGVKTGKPGGPFPKPDQDFIIFTCKNDSGEKCWWTTIPTGSLNNKTEDELGQLLKGALLQNRVHNG